MTEISTPQEYLATSVEENHNIIVATLPWGTRKVMPVESCPSIVPNEVVFRISAIPTT